MGKRLVLFGPPGVGKGTHSRRLAAELGIPHVATGDMFREAISAGTPLGLRAAQHMNGGRLVPDEIAVAILEDRLARQDARDGFLLDGFPRTLPQAEMLGRYLKDDGSKLDAVVVLEAPEELLVGRLVSRLTCSGCGASYNRISRPPQVAGVCDSCSSSLVARNDDETATVQTRLAAYHAKTEPVLSFFEGIGWPVRKVSSVGGLDEVYAGVKQAAQ
ncbi:MAG TPA: adenylate kinase [Polyangia bacterium]